MTQRINHAKLNQAIKARRSELKPLTGPKFKHKIKDGSLIAYRVYPNGDGYPFFQIDKLRASFILSHLKEIKEIASQDPTLTNPTL